MKTDFKIFNEYSIEFLNDGSTHEIKGSYGIQPEEFVARYNYLQEKYNISIEQLRYKPKSDDSKYQEAGSTIE